MFTCGPAMFAGTPGGGGGGAHLYYVELTIASGEVASDLTDFPVMVDLADMPAAFWTHVNADGGDIRVKATDGTTSIPMDLAKFDLAGEGGWLFFKRTVTTASNTVVRIYYGAAGLDLLPADDTYGSNACWSDYHRVTIFSEPGVDRSGNGYGAITYKEPGKRFGTPTQLVDLATTDPTNHTQGVYWDGTHWYVNTSKDLYKYDASWSLVTSVANAYTNVAGANHIGDGFVLGGLWYLPIENWNSGTGVGTGAHIAVFNASDLSFSTAYDVSVTPGGDISGIGYNPDDGYIWGTDYTEHTTLMRFTTAGVFVDTVSITPDAMSLMQGVTFMDGLAYVSTGVTGTGEPMWEVAQDGTVRRLLYSTGSAENTQGICVKDSKIIRALANGKIQEFNWDSAPAGAEDGWLNLNATSTSHARLDNGGAPLTSWTVGATAIVTDKSANRPVLSYAAEQTTVDTDRETLVYRFSAGTDRWGIWNSTDSWLTGGASPSTATKYRLNLTKNSTTDRKLWINGSSTTDTTTATRPSGADTSLFVGRGTSNVSAELFIGRINFVYLRSGVLSADWLAAETSNWLTPSGFYTIGSEQSA